MNEPMTGNGPVGAPAGDAGTPGREAPGSVPPHGAGGPAEPGATEPADEPAGPAPLGVDRTATGNAEVDARLARLADVDDLPADGHLEVYEDVHRGLRDTLTALDQRPGPPAPAAPYDHRS